MAATPNIKLLASKVEAKIAAQFVKAAPVSSLVSAPIKSSVSAPIFPVQAVVTKKAALLDELAIESNAKKSSSTSKKIDHLQTQLNNLHEVVHASNRERGKIKVSIADMESKLVGEMSNLAILIQDYVTKPVKHENKTNDCNLSPLDISVNSNTGSSHASQHLQKSFAANFNTKTPRGLAQAHIKIPHASQHSFVYEGVTYSTKIAEWNPEEEAYYHYADVKGRVIKICPCTILSKRHDEYPVMYYAQEYPNGENDVFDIEQNELYYRKPVEQVVRDSEQQIQPHRTFFMKPGMWKAGYWKKYSQDIFLEGDGVSQIRNFYEDIASVCRLSHATAAEVLPDYERLLSTETIRDLINPTKSCYYSQEAKAFLKLVSKIILDLLCSEKAISSITCPTTAMHRSTFPVRDGFSMLYHILRHSIPEMGFHPM